MLAEMHHVPRDTRRAQRSQHETPILPDRPRPKRRPRQAQAQALDGHGPPAKLMPRACEEDLDSVSLGEVVPSWTLFLLDQQEYCILGGTGRGVYPARPLTFACAGVLEEKPRLPMPAPKDTSIDRIWRLSSSVLGDLHGCHRPSIIMPQPCIQ
ncbi:hypothetical protein G6O67_000691 [Ophiocordyceps sinensis]|uniref:Uncharacterized protein n=1 Tax=Ophiocordyceps sinensis TaxID=72228 RepID=A0A8H4Q038_9HYPO|nr:hypothetical protein G6O67_000691 [Ophiocordyceps sinensis]